MYCTQDDQDGKPSTTLTVPPNSKESVLLMKHSTTGLPSCKYTVEYDATKKAPAKKVDLKDATRVYHVVKRPEDNKWAVKFAGGEKVIKLFDTQAEAIAYSKQMAENQGGKMLVHNSKGQNKGKIKSK